LIIPGAISDKFDNSIILFLINMGVLMSDFFENGTVATATKMGTLAFPGSSFDGPVSTNYFRIESIDGFFNRSGGADFADYFTFDPYKLQSVTVKFDGGSVGDNLSMMYFYPLTGVSRVEGNIAASWYNGIYDTVANGRAPDGTLVSLHVQSEARIDNVNSSAKSGDPIHFAQQGSITFNGTSAVSDLEFDATATWYLTGEPVTFIVMGFHGSTNEFGLSPTTSSQLNYDFTIAPKSGSPDEPVNPGDQDGGTTVDFNSISGSELNRGDGKDTVKVTGSRADHAISNINIATNSITIDGKTITNVERLQFSDGTIALDDEGIAGQAYRIYKAAFARTPDNDGLTYWIGEMDGSVSLLQASIGFVSSVEFKSVYGSNPTSLEIVARLYQNVLGRDGEAGGISYWVGEIDAGRQSTAQILVGFSESPENVAGVAPAIGDGIFFS
jgi:hypothetical protein